eukprot:CAMPEP_0203749674 /NCGR_PEP_ID=MMETSP0098-20131031/4142_1 /ASSEMBLY_ACC=CAM_ASM_000208 /TAXON_ID=96639 /ORGANISM=" , Strain NY0313808BC1" /LENGTH=496 /DNA_ID=CAMNT_0050638767 /DNA_START=201 /DNA_END=1691 /DNA_ORIENTATION=-
MECTSLASPRVSFPVHFAPYRVFRMFMLSIGLFQVFGFAAGDKTYFADANVRSCVCDGEFDANKDYFPVKSSKNYSTLWDVEYHDNYKVINDKATGLKTYLVLCGTPNITNIEDDAQVIQIPIKRAGVDSTTMFHYFEYLNQRTSLKYYHSNGHVIVNPCMQYLANENALLSLPTKPNQTDIDVLFVSKYNYDNSKDSLRSLGKPIIVLDAVHELLPLGKAEWIEWVATFFNRELAAAEIVGHINDRYACHKEKIKDVTNKKAVMMLINAYGADFSNDPNCDTFATLPIMYTRCPHVLCTFASDAATDLLSSDNTTQDEFKNKFSDVDAIIYYGDFESGGFGMPASCKSRFDSFFTELDVGKRGEVYDVFKTVSSNSDGTDFFEGLNAMPDVFLLDMISIFHPSIVPQDHNRQFLRKALEPNMEKKTVLTKDNCSNVEEPLYTEWREHSCNETSEAKPIQGLAKVQNEDVCSAPSATVRTVSAIVSLPIWLFIAYN